MDIRKSDVVRAEIPPYPEEIFQFTQGSWQLWPYVKYGPENEPKSGHKWIKLGENYQIYAKDPREDVAADGEVAAIDFGTTNTTVAEFKNNEFHMCRIGIHKEQIRYSDIEFENPTIMRFQNIDAFMEDYQKAIGRPETKFENISVSHPVKAMFKELKESGNGTNINVLSEFQNHLKQWMNDPAQMLYIERNGEWRESKYAELQEGDFDPIEVYAYYIGLYLNNMHNRKIYLKYLLSYSATYEKYNLEKFRESFARGLKKSLPIEVAEDEELMKKFEVTLQLDEATAYAVSAVVSYRAQAEIKKQYDTTQTANERFEWMASLDNLPTLDDYLHEMKNGGLFYGVYDFGGGTVDFSFGLARRIMEKDIFSPLKQGGNSHSGCENMLEDIAYRIFWTKSSWMQKHRFCCAPPSGSYEKKPWISNSSAAYFNTLNLVDYLRKCWLNSGEQLKAGQDSFRFLTEDNKLCSIKIVNKVQNTQAEATGDENSDSSQKNAQHAETNNESQNYISLELDHEKEIKQVMKEKISEDIEMFFEQFEAVAVTSEISNDKPRFIFMGGNASRSKLLKKLFKDKIQKMNKQDTYKWHPPLPTKFDEFQKQQMQSICVPEAKSGVVLGMLLARPELGVVSVEKLGARKFHYHIGCREFTGGFNFFGKIGDFRLVMSANEAQAGRFYRIERVKENNQIELLYTDKHEYGFELQKRLPAIGIPSIIINLEEQWRDYVIYCRPKEDSSNILELGVSEKDYIIIDMESMVEIIGECELGNNARFQPRNVARLQPLRTSPYVCISDKDTGRNKSYYLRKTNFDTIRVKDIEDLCMRYHKENLLFDGCSRVSIQLNEDSETEVIIENLFHGNEKIFCSYDSNLGGYMLYLYVVEQSESNLNVNNIFKVIESKKVIELTDEEKMAIYERG